MTTKSLVLSHGDLDGCVGAMVCKKYIQNKEGKEHEVVCIPCSYENINDYAREAFEKTTEYKYILVVDICFNEELLKIKPANCWVYDHHDTSKFIIGKDQCYWEEKYCGAVVAWKNLFAGEKMTPAFKMLMGYANDYDMWGSGAGPKQKSHDLNAVYNYYRYQDFFEKFYDGFESFTGEEADYLKSYWNKQQEILDATPQVSYGDDVLFLMISDERLDANYWSDKFLRKDGFNVVISIRPHKNRLSMRSTAKHGFHAGFWLQKNVQNSNNSKGGHAKAAGCSTEGMTEEEILQLGVKVQAWYDDKKGALV
jgi:oligoribonuclease NrnB/cAMP/cGMP phosphodiesterase (DHH superfamily)